MNRLTKPFILWLTASVLAAGIAAAGILIPTWPASHHSRLHTFTLGSGDAEQKLALVSGGVLIPDRIIVGDKVGGENTISTGADSAVIGGGAANIISGNATNAVIGAGRLNNVFAENATIGAGYFNRIEEKADWSFIGGGRDNRIQPNNSGSEIGGGHFNRISAANSVIPWGYYNTISSKNSIAIGSYTEINKEWTFAWSDDDDSYVSNFLTPSKANTFIIRSQNGMLITPNQTAEYTGIAHTGVNVTVEWAVHLTAQQLVKADENTCANTLAGTIEVDKGCFYFCDGEFRQSFNAAFNGGNEQGNADCKHRGRCYFDGVYLRPGDKVTGYSAPRAADCNSTAVKKELTCDGDPHFPRHPVGA